VDHQRIPLIIHLPGQKQPQVQTKPVGQIDIMPSIADLIGLDISQTPHLGRSVFVDSGALIETRMYLPSGSFINNDMLFMPQLSFDDGSAVNVQTGSAASPGGTERADMARVKELSRLSDAWLRSLPVRPDAGNGKDAIIPH
jgi:phosphoglycerol transferase MdoB-like AlkP superfamily enzyme